MAQLPADIIRTLSCLLTSSTDLVSLSLVCKRFHQLILSKIKDEEDNFSKKLLDLQVRQSIRVILEGEGGFAMLLSTLPSMSVIHGDVVRWQIDRTVAQNLMKLTNLRESDANSGYIIFNDSKNYVDALEMVSKKGKREATYSKYWNEYEGTCRYYAHDGKLTKEVNYKKGKFHGEASEMRGGEVISRYNWVNGKRHAVQYHYFPGSNGLIASRETYHNDELTGECEYFQLLEHPLPQLCRRVNIPAEGRGRAEEWSPETGIRTLMSEYNNGKRHGVEISWDEATGVRRYIHHYKAGQCYKTSPSPSDSSCVTI